MRRPAVLCWAGVACCSLHNPAGGGSGGTCLAFVSSPDPRRAGIHAAGTHVRKRATAPPTLARGRRLSAAAAATSGTTSSSSSGGGSSSDALTGVRPAYRLFWEQALSRLQEAMELTEYPVPEGMGRREAVVGKGKGEQRVAMEVAAYSAPKFRHIRTALVQTSGPTQVLNFVMFPRPDLDLPILGVDLVSLPGAHLICIDLQPPADPARFPQPSRHLTGLEAVAARAREQLPWGGDLPPAAQRFFSPHCIWSRAGSVEVVETAALEVMLSYLDHYLAAAATAQTVEDEELLAGLAEGHLAYSRYRRINDPARGMLNRYFGHEWAESVIQHVLFDLEAKVSTGSSSAPQLHRGQELLAAMNAADAAAVAAAAAQKAAQRHL